MNIINECETVHNLNYSLITVDVWTVIGEDIINENVVLSYDQTTVIV